jgi:hypothetical protein
LQFINDERLKAKNGPDIPIIYPPWSRFIVSCATDQTLADVRSRGASSRLENIGAHVVKLPELTFDLKIPNDETQPRAISFIEHVLRHQRRRLQPFQLDRICSLVSTITLNSLHDNALDDLPPSSPAYVNVLALQARRINNLESKPFPDMTRCSQFICVLFLF